MLRRKKMNIIVISLLGILATLVIYILISNDNNSNNEIANSSITTNIIEDDKNTDQNTDNKKDNQNLNDTILQVNNNINIPVLYYHSVNPSEENELIISPAKLKQQLQYIKNLGYSSITMKDYISYLKNNTPLPEKSVLITFDDGYMDNYTYLFPILKELDFKATIFLITSGIDDGYYLSTDQILEMHKYGIDFGSHTVNHSHLTELTNHEIISELTNSRDVLKKILKTNITSIAFPYGNYDERCIEAAQKAGYSVAFTTTYGTTNRSSNMYELKRIYVSSNYSFEQFKQRFENAK